MRRLVFREQRSGGEEEKRRRGEEETDRTPLYDTLRVQNDAVIEHYAGHGLTVANGDWVKGLAVGRALDLTRMPEGALFSPAWLRRCWLPRLKRLVDAWHSRDTLCIFHSDGNLWPVLDDLVAAGIDGLNPLEVLAGMTVEAVRARYSKQHLVLTGGIDVSQLLVYGTPDDVRAACRAAIRAAQGGYLMGSSTELHWDVPLKNAVAMFETAWEQRREGAEETQPGSSSPRS